ncbi:MAG: archemetzincin [Acidobacteriota bacterium]
MVEALTFVRLGLANSDGVPPLELLDRLAAEAARLLGASCRIEPEPLDISFSYDELRRQAWSTPVLARLAERPHAPGSAVVGVTSLDLFVPVFTFIFGEAQMAGPAAIISTCRLRDEFYGLPPNPALLAERLVKELLHELGHTQGLRHCGDWRCVMSSAHTVERIDVRQAAFCPDCARFLQNRAHL